MHFFAAMASISKCFNASMLWHQSQNDAMARKIRILVQKKTFWELYSLSLCVLEYRQTFFDYFFFDVNFSDKTPASEFSQGYKPLASSCSVLMTIPRVEEVFCPVRLSDIRDIKKCSNRLQSQMFSHIVDVLSCCCDHPKPGKQRLVSLG
jgi:hypothetical protein